MEEKEKEVPLYVRRKLTKNTGHAWKTGNQIATKKGKGEQDRTKVVRGDDISGKKGQKGTLGAQRKKKRNTPCVGTKGNQQTK